MNLFTIEDNNHAKLFVYGILKKLKIHGPPTRGRELQKNKIIYQIYSIVSYRKSMQKI